MFDIFRQIYFNSIFYDKKISKFYNKSLEIQLDLVGNDHIDVAFLYYNIGECYVKQGNYPKAIKIYEQLMLSNPEKKLFFASRINYIKQKTQP